MVSHPFLVITLDCRAEFVCTHIFMYLATWNHEKLHEIFTFCMSNINDIVPRKFQHLFVNSTVKLTSHQVFELKDLMGTLSQKVHWRSHQDTILRLPANAHGKITNEKVEYLERSRRK